MGGLGCLVLIGLARHAGGISKNTLLVLDSLRQQFLCALKCVVEARAENYLSRKLSPNAQPLLHNLEQKGTEMPQP